MTRWTVLFVLGCSPLRHIPSPPVVAPQGHSTPPQADSHYVRGRIALLQGDLDSARASFTMARVFDPKSPHIPIALGEVALVGGDRQAAAAAWLEATRVDPACAKAWMYRARISRLSGAGDVAVAHYGRARVLGYGWQAWAGEIDAWLHAGNRPEALRVMTQWLAVAELSPQASAERGQRRLILGDADGAATDLYVGVWARPEDHGRIRRWTSAVLMLDDRSAGVSQAEALRARAPDATAPLWALAILADSQGDEVRLQGAIEAWRALAPQDERLVALLKLVESGDSR